MNFIVAMTLGDMVYAMKQFSLPKKKFRRQRSYATNIRTFWQLKYSSPKIHFVVMSIGGDG